MAMQYSYLGGNIIIHFKSVAPGFEAYQLVETMIKVCQLCNAIYAPITYIFSSVVLHQKWLKLPLPVESRLKKIVKKSNKAHQNDARGLKNFFESTSLNRLRNLKKKTYHYHLVFVFSKSNSENFLILDIQGEFQQVFSSEKFEIVPKFQKISKFDPNKQKNPRNSP